ncbi:reverse transcriptase domain-containing protein [Saccharopolyspora spinosa]|uniref:reverse transcriptase domain-containing protein n=1 Tax=Saccharopolyspora spinosa TaxID=60894 RepID=UPI001ED8D6D8|nr:reverse transcriptase domain-containing protein [Saccharopolyspora spinosa]
MLVEPVFHPDSYGYRPGRSPRDAVGTCRKRCWKYDWAIDLDVQKFFDTVPWELIVKAVQHHTDLPWVLLYVKRWLAAPIQHPDGAVVQRDRGTPQGSAISPVLANLFMHYAFDVWMVREFPAIPFERFADDVIVHCTSQAAISPVLANLFMHYAFDVWMVREFPAIPFERFADDVIVHCTNQAQARLVLAAIDERMHQVGLRLHPDKTRIVYCQDGKRRGQYEHTSFVFLGFEFRARRARNRNGKSFSGFLTAISKQATAKLSAEVRSWRLHRCTGSTDTELARRINPKVRGWMQYYGVFYRSAMYPLLTRINAYLVRWLRKKYKRLRSKKKALQCWQRMVAQRPRFLAHWAWVSWVPRVW